MIIMGVQGQVRCFYENENLNSVLKKTFWNVSIDYLNVVFTSDQIWDLQRGYSLGLFPDFGVGFS